MNSDKEKTYKHYNPQTKQVSISIDVVFDESVCWYSLLILTRQDSLQNSKDETSETSTIVYKEVIDSRKSDFILAKRAE